MQIEADYPLLTHNSFGFDVKARFWAEARSTDDICRALSFAKAQALPLLVMGEGSNLVLTGDFPGLALNVVITGKEIVGEDSGQILVSAGAGENWHAFVEWSLQQQLNGLENLILIPGAVGAAPIQNIGAYGVELESCFYQLEAVSRETGELLYFDKDACEFGYRNSIFKGKMLDRVIISRVILRLSKTPHLTTDYGEIEAELLSSGVAPIKASDVADAVSRIRRRKLPDPREIGNAGSFFKNPIIHRSQFEPLKARFPGLIGYGEGDAIKVAAGWLVEACGWKGWREGDAGVHNGQALVLVNYGQATGEQVLSLASRIKLSVKQRFGIDLELEPRVYR